MQRASKVQASRRIYTCIERLPRMLDNTCLLVVDILATITNKINA